MFEIFTYPFFINALVGWVLIALCSTFLWVSVVMRKEANISHSISHFLFFGMALALLFQGNYYLYAIIFAVLASVLIFFIEKWALVTKESSKEMISQLWMAAGIVVIGLLDGLSLDINQLLFGNILFVTYFDIFLLSWLFIFILTVSIIFGRRFLSIIIHPGIARSQWRNIEFYQLWFLIILSLFIAFSIKIFGILLVWAFLVIPANIAKQLAPSLKKVFIYTGLLSVFSVIWWLLASYYLETSSGATIVLLLMTLFSGVFVWKQIGRS